MIYCQRRRIAVERDTLSLKTASAGHTAKRAVASVAIATDESIANCEQRMPFCMVQFNGCFAPPQKVETVTPAGSAGHQASRRVLVERAATHRRLVPRPRARQAVQRLEIAIGTIARVRAQQQGTIE